MANWHQTIYSPQQHIKIAIWVINVKIKLVMTLKQNSITRKCEWLILDYQIGILLSNGSISTKYVFFLISIVSSLFNLYAPH